jgi:GntP family gluconate:H+ symporter
LAAASILNFDLGAIVIVGMIVGLVAAVVAMIVWFKVLNKGFWNPEKDETGLVKVEDAAEIDSGNLPSSVIAIIPIIVPVICILLGTSWKAVIGNELPGYIAFISDKTIAILLGLLCAYFIAKKRMSWQALSDSTALSLKAAGIVILVTGAGGAFGAIIKATGIGDVLTKGLSGDGTSTLLILLITFLIGVIFRVAQGSGTVASITSMTIMSGVASSVACHPVYIAIAALAGGNFIGHVNDSGFWVVTNLSGLNVTGGLKAYTFNTVILAGTAFILALLGSIIFPMI